MVSVGAYTGAPRNRVLVTRETLSDAKQRIVRAGVQCVIRGDVSDASMSAIATEAGVSTALLQPLGLAAAGAGIRRAPGALLALAEVHDDAVQGGLAVIHARRHAAARKTVAQIFERLAILLTRAYRSHRHDKRGVHGWSGNGSCVR